MSIEDAAPAAPQDQDPTPEPAPGPEMPGRLSPRIGPIIWGCLILAFCAYLVQRLFAPDSIEPVFWITGTVFALGALLLGVGIAILIRNARRGR